MSEDYEDAPIVENACDDEVRLRGANARASSPHHEITMCRKSETRTDIA